MAWLNPTEKHAFYDSGYLKCTFTQDMQIPFLLIFLKSSHKCKNICFIGTSEASLNM